VALPLRLGLDWHRALFVAACLCGPVSVWLLGAALAWAAAPLADRGFLWAAPLVAGLSAPVMVYGALGVAHHHVLLVAGAVFVAGCMGRAAAGDRLSGWRGGVAAAAAIWLTPETMPAILAAFALPALQAGRPAARAGMALGGLGFALVLLLAWLVDPPALRWAPEVDRLSVVYLGLGAAVAIGGAVIWAIPRLPAVLVAAGCLGAWLAVFPALLRGPEGMMDPTTARAFFGNIAEMQPVDNLGEAALFLLPGLVSAALLGAIAWRRRSLPWAYAALVCVRLACPLRRVLRRLHGRRHASAADQRQPPAPGGLAAGGPAGHVLRLRAAAGAARLRRRLAERPNHLHLPGPRGRGAAGPARRPGGADGRERRAGAAVSHPDPHGGIALSPQRGGLSAAARRLGQPAIRNATRFGAGDRRGLHTDLPRPRPAARPRPGRHALGPATRQPPATLAYARGHRRGHRRRRRAGALAPPALSGPWSGPLCRPPTAEDGTAPPKTLASGAYVRT
jgi:hypothetical protein